MKRAIPWLVAGVMVIALAGCGGVTQRGFGGTRTNTGSYNSATRHTREQTVDRHGAQTASAKSANPAQTSVSGQPLPAGPAQTHARGAKDSAQPEIVTDEKYNGWDCYKLRNNLITVVAVPAIGGRIMEYKLGPYPFLFTNEEEYGKVYTDVEINAQQAWHNFGGFKVWPAPQSTWEERLSQQWPPPAVFDLFPFEPKVLADKLVASLQLVSEKDPEGTGLQTRREVSVYPRSTRVTVTETFQNVTDKPITWSIWDVTQVRTALEKDKPFSEQAVVYFPLDKLSKLEKGYRELITEPDNEVERQEQWKPEIAPGIMGVVYKHQKGKIGADSMDGWIAYVDELHHYVYVKRFEVFTDEDYPDRGCTVEVYTDGDKPYMEVEVLGPLRELMPDESYSFTVDWFATRCNGPILSCTEAGVVSQPLKLTQQPDRDPVLSGKFGVFHEGKARILFINAQGAATEYKQIDVTPMTPLELGEPVAVPDGTKSIAVQILNAAGTPIAPGFLSEVKLG